MNAIMLKSLQTQGGGAVDGVSKEANLPVNSLVSVKGYLIESCGKLKTS